MGQRDLAVNDLKWNRWLIRTARCWDDLKPLLRDVGIEQIDCDHREIMELILGMESLNAGSGEGDVDLHFVERQSEMFRKLRESTLVHFETERATAKDLELQAYNNYKGENQRFLDRLEGFIDDFESGRLAVNSDLRLDLVEWYVEHMNVAYNIFLVERLLNESFYRE